MSEYTKSTPGRLGKRKWGCGSFCFEGKEPCFSVDCENNRLQRAVDEAAKLLRQWQYRPTVGRGDATLTNDTTHWLEKYDA